MNKTVKVALTGAAGQIGYSLLFRIASGQMFGLDTPVQLQLLELEQALSAAEGVIMELEDCAFPLLEKVEVTSRPDEAFSGVNWALLVGSVPRKKGMYRKDLLQINAGVFVEQGRALQENAANDVQILVVGNPCNTNCFIAMNQAKDIPKNRWFAMTKLDENRAKFQLAKKADVPVKEVTRVAIWGNHSATQYPDFFNAQIQGKKATEAISDQNWLEKEFIPKVQKRGAAVIESRGASSAASAANAAIETVKQITTKTPENDWFSVALASKGEYGVEKDLIFGYPVKSDGSKVEIVEGIELNAFGKEKFNLTHKELQDEKHEAKSFLSCP